MREIESGDRFVGSIQRLIFSKLKIMMYLKIANLALPLLLLISCGGDDSPTAFDACGNPTTETINDKRCLYTVSTLTDSFDGSGGLTVDAEGFIYVADFGNQITIADGKTVSKVDPQTGAVSLFASGLDGPSGNAFAANGNLIQANIQGNFISEITPDGQVSTLSDIGLRSPVGVALDEDQNIYVCNCQGRTIQKIEPDGTSAVFSQGGTFFNCPNGLTRDGNGNFYVANFGNGNIVKVTPDGTPEIFATLPGNNNSHLVFANNVIYALSRSGNKLYELTLEGEISLIAGTGTSGNDDGDGNVATFYIPNGIGISPDGNKIYVVSRLVGQGSPLNPVVVRVIQEK